MAPSKVLSPGSIFHRKTKRTHLSTTEVLDGVYTPRLPVARELRHYFEPTRITDEGGELNEAIAEDLLGKRERVVEKVVQYAG